jgi:hypothetical protein
MKLVGEDVDFRWVRILCLTCLGDAASQVPTSRRSRKFIEEARGRTSPLYRIGCSRLFTVTLFKGETARLTAKGGSNSCVDFRNLIFRRDKV